MRKPKQTWWAIVNKDDREVHCAGLDMPFLFKTKQKAREWFPGIRSGGLFYVAKVHITPAPARKGRK